MALADGESLTSTGELMGSLDYIAPERLPAQRPVLAGAVAYDEPDIPDCAGPLSTLIEGLLHKDPTKRLSAADTADALRSLGTQEPGTLKQTLRAPTLPHGLGVADCSGWRCRWLPCCSRAVPPPRF